MKLVNVDLSPFASRVRLQIYFKKLDIPLVLAPADMKTPEYLAMNPMAKLPVLVLDDGTCLPESEIILEYIEDVHPNPSLRPADPQLRAKGRLIGRITDLYVMESLRGLAPQFDPKTRDAAAVEAVWRQMETSLKYVEHYWSGARFALSDAFSLADCSILPMLFIIDKMGQFFRMSNLLSPHKKLSAYWSHVQKESAVAKVFAEMQAGFDERFGQNSG
jgi:glutathione S-transferase